VLVGHEPDLGKLAGVLLFGAPAALPLRKAGACSIEFDNHCAAGKGRLRIPWLLAEVGRHGRCQSAILELWTPPAGSTEATIEREALWAGESLRFLKPLFA